MSDVEDTIEKEMKKMRTELKECLNYVHNMKSEMTDLKQDFEIKRQKDMNDIKSVKESIAEWVD